MVFALRQLLFEIDRLPPSRALVQGSLVGTPNDALWRDTEAVAALGNGASKGGQVRAGTRSHRTLGTRVELGDGGGRLAPRHEVFVDIEDKVIKASADEAKQREHEERTEQRRSETLDLKAATAATATTVSATAAAHQHQQQVQRQQPAQVARERSASASTQTCGNKYGASAAIPVLSASTAAKIRMEATATVKAVPPAKVAPRPWRLAPWKISAGETVRHPVGNVGRCEDRDSVSSALGDDGAFCHSGHRPQTILFSSNEVGRQGQYRERERY